MRQKLGQMLIEAGLIDEAGLQSALADQRRWGLPLGRTLVDLRLIREDELVRVLGQQLGVPLIDLDAITIPKPVLDTVPIALVQQHALIPFAVSNKFLDVAMSDPMNLGVIDEIRIRSQLNVRPHLAGPQMVERAIARHYGGAASSMLDRVGPSRGRSTKSPESIPLDPSAYDDAPLALDDGTRKPGPAPASAPRARDREIDALQQRIFRLEALVERDEAVLRKLLALLIDKGVATREEIVERLG